MWLVPLVIAVIGATFFMNNLTSAKSSLRDQLAITKMRQRSLNNVGVGVSLDGPATDFAALAKSFGIYGEGPILDPEEIRPALERGLKVVKEQRRPVLIDTVTQSR